MAELVICPRCDRRFDRDMVKDGFAICPYCEEEVEFPVMTREEVLERYDRIRYNLLNHDDKVAVDVAFEALREQTKLATNLQPEANSCKWISVKERLPDTYKNVLCCKDRDIRIGYYLGATYSERVEAFRDLRSAFAFGATHWMPLPEPPKEDV